MAEVKMKDTGREYIIPLRREWMKVSRYKRTARAVIEIKKFVAKHMRVENRDLDKVKLDVYLNNEMWFRGCKKPPAKVKVLVKREGEFVKVEMVDLPEKWEFIKKRQAKIHKKAEKKKIEKKKEEELENKVDGEKAEDKDKDNDGIDDKVEEKEKAKSGEIAQTKIAEKAAKVQKHTIKGKAPQIQRKALKK